MHCSERFDARRIQTWFTEEAAKNNSDIVYWTTLSEQCKNPCTGRTLQLLNGRQEVAVLSRGMTLNPWSQGECLPWDVTVGSEILHHFSSGSHIDQGKWSHWLCSCIKEGAVHHHPWYPPLWWSPSRPVVHRARKDWNLLQNWEAGQKMWPTGELQCVPDNFGGCSTKERHLPL